MNKYQTGKIYKLIDNTSDMIYIGYTFQELEKRLQEYEHQFKSYKAGKFNYITSFRIIQNENYKIELIKLYPCNTNKELEFQVNKISIELRNRGLNVINKIIIGIPIKESRPQYYHDNKQTINDKQKQKHDFKNIKTINNHGTINITINVNSVKELKQSELDFLNAIK